MVLKCLAELVNHQNHFIQPAGTLLIIIENDPWFCSQLRLIRFFGQGRCFEYFTEFDQVREFFI